MKILKILVITLGLMLVFTACGKNSDLPVQYDATEVSLSDEGIKVNGFTASTDSSEDVYIANDIVYYEDGKDFTYGEGTEKDAHSKAEAEAHTVVHITKAGTYLLEGKLSKGQIAVDLGEDAKENPEAVVTLILGGVDITCDVAPGVIFYNVYECGNTDTEKATKDADTSNAGANVIIADGSINTVNGSYVERIYDQDTIVFNEDKTEVEDAKKLHKYDGAFYSKMSMNIDGEKENSGVLNINASNEGLDSELHLAINGGSINISSGNDGINTNEDGVSVTTINGGTLRIRVTGETGEGDGIDSNGWLVINGGTVVAEACSQSADAGIDSDMGIHINGGTVIATGSMLDRVEADGQNYAVFSFAEKQNENTSIILKNEAAETVREFMPENAYSTLIYSSPDLTAGTYTLWSGDKQLLRYGSGFGGHGRPDMMPEGTKPEGEPPEMPEGFEPPEGFEVPENDLSQSRPQKPDGEMPPMGQKPHEDAERPEKPEENGEIVPTDGESGFSKEHTDEFKITDGGNMFSIGGYVNQSE
ncbi:MAG: carbohydrate-binding domain-containing protein [Clostridia bacterium]|nr:carbohydrate-binding domain-containing protein [Clostridia bacterium]MBQ5904697.1 carbohydrate-binding domain-containing protein [Clostridia bacterium]